ncbi:MAG: hypothetical protein A2288_03580 [Candidatus Moranbacteria bacterium RIFOXYA12_FULL_44_15]|nr:MAG: hypothetical protein A2288_03580 [Candidatus Moranbacteria bacterium RIFOXYA12_FULL_44_15]
MTGDVTSVTPDTKVTEVARILFQHRFHGMPVLENGKVVGIITEDDFYIKDSDNLFLPSYINFLKDVRTVDNLPRDKEEKIRKILNARAADIMTPDCLTASPDWEVDALLARMKETKFNTWPVAGEKGNLLGIVTLMDIVGLMQSGNETISALANQIAAGKPREIDELIGEVRTFWEKTFVLIRAVDVKTWKRIFLIAFITGVAAALIWNVSVKIKKSSGAKYYQQP